MPMTHVDFHTSIDCCKRWMKHISGATIDFVNPSVGDYVQVYRDSEFELFMKVVQKTWKPDLLTVVCELYLDDIWGQLGINALETCLKKHGFHCA